MAEKDLHSLIRLAQYTVDERRRVLGERLQILYRLEDEAAALESRVLAEQEVARLNPEFAVTYGAFAEGVNRMRARLAELTAEAELRIAEAQGHLAEAYQDLKSYEESQRLRDARTRREEDRREQAVLDEIGGTAYLRNRPTDEV